MVGKISKCPTWCATLALFCLNESQRQRQSFLPSSNIPLDSRIEKTPQHWKKEYLPTFQWKVTTLWHRINNSQYVRRHVPMKTTKYILDREIESSKMMGGEANKFLIDSVWFSLSARLQLEDSSWRMLISSISPINSLVSRVAQLLDLPDPLFHIPGSGCAKNSVTSRMIQDIKFGCYGLPKFRAVPQTKTGSSVKNIPMY